MIDLEARGNNLKSPVLEIAQAVTGVSDEWLARATARTGNHTWACTGYVNEMWASCDKTPSDESQLYSSSEFAFDCIRCFLTVTRENVRRTVRGIIELRERIPNFGDGWTFVDFYAGVGLSTVYFAKLLESTGINARVVYHNSPNSTTQIDLAKRFALEAGMPKNLDFEITDDIPYGDCFMFYEVLEHFRQPWEFMSKLVEKRKPQAVVHASSFTLPECAGHFEVYEINGRAYSGSAVAKYFERAFSSAGYVNVNSSHCWDNSPTWQLLPDYVPEHELTRAGRWDLKGQQLTARRNALISHKCNVFLQDFKHMLNDCSHSSKINDEQWESIENAMLERLVNLAKDKHLLRSSGF